MPCDMPDVPELDFVGALAEIWFAISYAVYDLAYVRVYLQSATLQMDIDEVRWQDDPVRNMMQADAIIWRFHLAAFFWELDHVFEALRAAFSRGQKGHPSSRHCW